MSLEAPLLRDDDVSIQSTVRTIQASELHVCEGTAGRGPLTNIVDLAVDGPAPTVYSSGVCTVEDDFDGVGERCLDFLLQL